jgi:hypothetical protein
MIQDDATHQLHFGIQRSIRYHDRRVAHFDFLHKITNVLTILLSGIVFVELSGTHAPAWLNYVAAVAAVLGACDLVVGYSHRAGQHRDLKRRFIALERQLIASKTKEGADAVRCERLEIEAEEPPVFRALDAMCHNELLTARGYSPTDHEEKLLFKKLPRFTRWTANWFCWANHSSAH